MNKQNRRFVALLLHIMVYEYIVDIRRPFGVKCTANYETVYWYKQKALVFKIIIREARYAKGCKIKEKKDAV